MNTMTTSSSVDSDSGRLDDIESCAESKQARYVRLETAIEHATLPEIRTYYARMHGIAPEDVENDRRFPFHEGYVFGHARACCDDCVDLEMAILVNIPLKKTTLGKWFPALV